MASDLTDKKLALEKKGTWTKPALTMLTRGNFSQNLLTFCKWNWYTGPTGLQCGIQSGNTFTTCLSYGNT